MTDRLRNTHSNSLPGAAACRAAGRLTILHLSVVCFMAATGCQTIEGVPVSRVPAELLRTDLKSKYEDISLLRLRQDPPKTYLLGPGDVLGIYIKGVLGNEAELPPVHYPEDSNRPPAIGYPVPIREDGSLALPFIAPIRVDGISLVEATELVRSAYTRQGSEIVRPDRDQIIITLIRKRAIRVLVIREEGGGKEGVTKRGTGHVVDLPAYENDVLRALSETGGMPGTDAKNEVLIYRGLYSDAVNYDQLVNNLCQDNCQDPCFCNEAPLPDPPNVTRIPLRYNPANPPVFTQQDVILGEGDIVIIRSRDTETFYTAGAMGGGEFPLPRDKDLDIIGAIAIAGGPLGNSGTGVGSIGQPNRGSGRNSTNCQPSQAFIVREMPCGNSITMKVDLNRALQNRGERVMIQPGDVIVLRYTLTEEISNALLNLVQFNFLLNGLQGGGF